MRGSIQRGEKYVLILIEKNKKDNSTFESYNVTNSTITRHGIIDPDRKTVVLFQLNKCQFTNC